MAKAKKILEAVSKRLTPIVNWFNGRALKFTAIFRQEIFIILVLALLVLICVYTGILFDVLVILALGALLYLILRIIKIPPKKKCKKDKTMVWGLTKFWLYFYATCIAIVVISIAYEYKIIR